MAGKRVLPALVGLLAAIATATALAAAGDTSWGKAIEVPGTAALNTLGDAQVNSVSCASAGNCAAGGFYSRFEQGRGLGRQAFVVSQTSGVWRTAIEVPRTAALNVGGDARVSSVSCASAGNCAAGGYYSDGFDDWQAFVVSQKNGVWRAAIEVPRTADLNLYGDARVNSVSCASAGNCAAGGYYSDGSGKRQAFVVSQTNGVWGAAIEVPGTAALNIGGDAQVNSVSCASAGNCAAGGYYSGSHLHYYSVNRQSFVVSEKNGVWGAAIEVPGTAARNTGDDAEVNSVSCARQGNCAAGGYYNDSSSDSYGHWQAFVVSQTSGVWRTAIEVPGTAALNIGDEAEVNSVSCASAGNCAAGGYYYDSSPNSSGNPQAFVVSQKNGVWRTAIKVPGTAALSTNGADVHSVSCASAGNCAAGGYYRVSSDNLQAFVVSQKNGVWRTAIKVPGTAALNVGAWAQVTSVSCAKSALFTCAAGGFYTDSSVIHLQAFVTKP